MSTQRDVLVDAFVSAIAENVGPDNNNIEDDLTGVPRWCELFADVAVRLTGAVRDAEMEDLRQALATFVGRSRRREPGLWQEDLNVVIAAARRLVADNQGETE
jgi:hypothetical protein